MNQPTKLPDVWPFPTDQRVVNAPLEQLATPVTRRKAAISKCGKLAQRINRPPLTNLPDAPY